MKFTGFKVVPCLRANYPDTGILYAEIDEDQDPLLLARAAAAELHNDCALPDDLELRWTRGESILAVRLASSVEGDETPISGDFAGLGWLVEAAYTDDAGVSHTTVLAEGDNQEGIERMCAGLSALLAPVRIVVDITGGAIHGVESDRPAQILFVSNDSDDVQDFDAPCLVPPSENMEDPHAWWMREAELDGFIVDHYHNQVKPC
ncbi:hypothetical protein [Stutzerimonas stutzeri]|uniref:hypothetical protein n=1 Tax=Stutzerimonas stutzeri TaxID=316 RepID=UPI0008393163|nr:hypothetical protein [Stutzerimonas stutzeri]OCX57148.1 hypothetical protein BFM99_13850 [Stutzerimonas stutzeri]